MAIAGITITSVAMNMWLSRFGF